jgi:hypothetical protein
MTTLTIEHYDPPSSARGAREWDLAGERIADELAGRTVWCATALPAGRRPARALRAFLEHAGRGTATAPLDVAAGEPLRPLAERLDEMLWGAAPQPAPLGHAERAIMAESVAGSERLVSARVGRDDVVVVHDALTALLARAVRERGAHAVWHVHVSGGRHEAMAVQALDFLRRFTAGVDAYIMTWSQPAARGERVQSIAAVMPSAGIVAAKEIHGGDGPRELAWNAVLAEVVRGDRGECVGGTLGPRPTVAVR